MASCASNFVISKSMHKLHISEQCGFVNNLIIHVHMKPKRN